MVVAEKIIEMHKIGKRFKFVYKEELQHFLKEKYGIKTKSKSESIDKAYELLSVKTLKFFAENIERFGISQGDAEKCLGISRYKIKKLINEGNIRVVCHFKFTGGGINDIGNYECTVVDVLDVIKLADLVEEKKKYNKKVMHDIPCTESNLAEALYVISESAVKSKYTECKAYYKREEKVCHAAKTRSSNLYHLRDVALNKMCQDGLAKYQGIYKQISYGTPVYWDFYISGDYNFYSNHEGRVDKRKVIGELADEDIDEDQTEKVSIKFNQAVNLLERYCGISATGTYNRDGFGHD